MRTSETWLLIWVQNWKYQQHEPSIMTTVAAYKPVTDNINEKEVQEIQL
jgi:hypothetical protein